MLYVQKYCYFVLRPHTVLPPNTFARPHKKISERVRWFGWIDRRMVFRRFIFFTSIEFPQPTQTHSGGLSTNPVEAQQVENKAHI